LFIGIYLGLIGLLALAFMLPAQIVVQPSRIDLPADGLARHPIQVRVDMPFLRHLLFPHPRISVEFIQGTDYVSIFPSGEVRLGNEETTVFARSRAAEGEAIVRFKVHNAKSAQLQVFTHTVSADSDGDGFPDAFKLDSFNDREAFRHAFAMIADLQFVRVSPEWPVDQRDSFGLIQFAFREALRQHTEFWQQRQPIAVQLRSVEKYNYPVTPLGEKIFRTRASPYHPDDLVTGAFAESVDGETLKKFNTTYVGRNCAQAQMGDLMFFSQSSDQQKPWLVMIFLGKPFMNSNGQDDWVVYHTGPMKDGPGIMMRNRIAVLENNADLRLRPVQSNKNFLGFFRLKILK
jgi:uncharacterized protein YfaT (DUF1175 family)